MIYDGYTEAGNVGTLGFVYRPALSAERWEVRRQLELLRAKGVISDLVDRHILWLSRPVMSDDDLESLFHVCLGLIPPETGSTWTMASERSDAQNLYDGVILAHRHPVFDQRKCSDCKKWWYDDETGNVKKKNGKLIKRPDWTVLLCKTHDGCPRGTPEKQKGLTQKNRRAWKHYQECKAVGRFPDDPIVRRNAHIIERALKAVGKSGR